MDNRPKNLILITLPILLLLIFSFILQVFIISNPELINKFLNNLGLYFVLAYIILQTIFIILAPLNGSLIQIAVIGILGPALGLTLTYLVVTPAYLINFFIARKYGRPLVTKIVGKTALAKFDHFVIDTGFPVLIILRTFLGSYFDFISYAYGLTTIRVKTFIIINFIFGIPHSLIAYFVYSNSNDFFISVVTVSIISGIFSAIAIFLTRILNKRKLKRT
ncbi:TVP38/TMEM64 family protein [Candidatus Parcubacteria bacterium]|nr:MAG: TVP38/TMEM64 family protein [Candidatus Parcubacteria bacterium]